MMQKLAGLFLEQRSDRIKVTHELTLYHVIKDVIAIGSQSKVRDDVICATIITFSLVPIVEAELDLPLLTLERASSSAAARLAVIYANHRDVLWENISDVSADQLKEIRTIDTLRAIAAKAVMGQHIEFASSNAIRTQAQLEALADFEHKWNTYTSSFVLRSTDGIEVSMRDTSVLLHIAMIAISPFNECQELITVTPENVLKYQMILPDDAERLIREYSEQVARLAEVRKLQLKLIDAGLYNMAFEFR